MLSRLIRSSTTSLKSSNPLTTSRVFVDLKRDQARVHHAAELTNTSASELSSTQVSTASTTKPFYMTTPIFYVNAEPHLGHMFSVLIADVSCRWRTINGEKALFMAGTDEHGIKVKEASEKAGFTSPKEFCDDISSKFKSAWEALNINHGGFYRTTDSSHQQTVYALWNWLESRGYIYEGEYSGWYCKSDEAFVTETNLIKQEDGSFRTESGHTVEWLSERTYKFSLSKFAEPLRKWLEENPDAVTPASRYHETLAMIDAGLDDLSISRPMSRVQWGMPVPGRPDDAIYVWMDALAIYLSAAKDFSSKFATDQVPENLEGIPDELNAAPFWPADVQLLGKDIVRFHCIFWPAFLLASGIPLPKRIHAHGHWQVEGVKMSKSLGNVLAPSSLISLYGVDSSRYGLIRLGSVNDDMSFSHTELINQLNAELANNIGNLSMRVTSLALLPDQYYPDPLRNYRLADGSFDFQKAMDHNLFTPEDVELQNQINALYSLVDKHFRDIRPDEALHAINEFTSFVNVYVTKEAPWKLKPKKGEPEDPTQTQRMTMIIYHAIEAVRIALLCLQPLIPSTSEVMLKHLGISVPFDGSYSIRPLCKFGYLPAENQLVTLSQNIPFVKLEQPTKPVVVKEKKTKNPKSPKKEPAPIDIVESP